jgi:RNA polymerase sigma factor (sigma-70 family)
MPAPPPAPARTITDHGGAAMPARIAPDRLVADYLRPLLNFARRRIRYFEALGALPRGQLRPEEIVDAAFAEALSEVKRQRMPQEPLYPWLRRLARRALAAAVRDARQRRQERSLEEELHSPRVTDEGEGRPLRLIDVIPDPSAPIPAEVAEGHDFQLVLAGLLGDLPEAWREPLLLHVRDGYSLREVARMEGITVAQARRRIELAREYLRARVLEEYEEMPAAPDVEELFAVLEHAEPAQDHHEHLVRRLTAAAEAPAPGQGA